MNKSKYEQTYFYASDYPGGTAVPQSIPWSYSSNGVQRTVINSPATIKRLNAHRSGTAGTGKRGSGSGSGSRSGSGGATLRGRPLLQSRIAQRTPSTAIHHPAIDVRRSSVASSGSNTAADTGSGTAPTPRNGAALSHSSSADELALASRNSAAANGGDTEPNDETGTETDTASRTVSRQSTPVIASASAPAPNVPLSGAHKSRPRPQSRSSAPNRRSENITVFIRLRPLNESELKVPSLRAPVRMYNSRPSRLQAGEREVWTLNRRELQSAVTERFPEFDKTIVTSYPFRTRSHSRGPRPSLTHPLVLPRQST